jgi:hypothetical protein
MPLVFQPLGYHSAPAVCFPLTPVPSKCPGLFSPDSYIADFLLAELYGTVGPGVSEQDDTDNSQAQAQDELKGFDQPDSLLRNTGARRPVMVRYIMSTNQQY